MRYVLVTACYLLMLALTGPIASYAQESDKKQKDAKGAILESLHPSLAEASAPMGIKLLTGYTHKAGTDFEGNKVGVISKEGGVKIRYEIGMSQGHAVDLNMKDRYRWYKEQIIQGRKIKLALDRENELLITIPLDEKSSWNAANFYGVIKKPEDMVDMTLMILSVEP